MFDTIVLFFLIACFTGLVATALVRRWARRAGFVDYPDDHRKLHQTPTPLGGGLAVFLGTAPLLGLLAVVPNPARDVLLESRSSLLVLLGAGTVIVALGLLDDRFKLRGRQKLAGQVVAASIVVAGGLQIERLQIFGWQFELGHLAILATVVWLLGAINAINLLDGIDGLATMLGIILSVTFAAIAGLGGKYAVATVALVFAGVLTGFLRYNFPPARMFLGDAGSMLIGLVVGTLAIQGSLKGPGTVLLAAPLAVWAIPVLDSAVAILRRKLTGRSIYSTDRGHLHHRLLSLLGSSGRVLAVVALCCAVTSGAALLSVYLLSDTIAVISFVAIVVMFIATGVFGRAEAVLLVGRLRKAGVSLVKARRGNGARASNTAVRLQGSARWELLWDTLTEWADKLCLSEIRLDVNLPADQEGFHALWRRDDDHEDARRWRVELPLLADNRSIGGLLIMGQCYGESACHVMEQLLEVIEPFEAQLASITNGRKSVAEVEVPVAAGAGDLPTNEDFASDSRD